MNLLLVEILEKIIEIRINGFCRFLGLLSTRLLFFIANDRIRQGSQKVFASIVSCYVLIGVGKNGRSLCASASSEKP